jgi:hypothetical protein
MIPKPPFERDLSLASEIGEFARLKGRLQELWAAVFPADDQPYTSVVVPSVHQAREPWSIYLEERLLFLLIRLRNPQARLVYVTSQPLHPWVVEYYLQLLFGVPASHARARLTLLSAHDHSPRPLAQKILDRPRLLERIRAGIGDKARAYLSVPESTPLERRLAVLLDIPLNGLDPGLAFLSGDEQSREIFEQAGVESAEPGEASAAATFSVEIRINPRGQASLSSTHEHERADASHPRRAHLFPAQEAYRPQLHEAAARTARVLARRGVSGRFSVEFAAAGRASQPALRASGLRFGMGDVTHPMLAMRFLTGGALDPASGLFRSPRGQAKFYRASDDVGSESYRGLLPEDLVEILTADHIGFNQRSETGVLFHMIGAVSQFGRFGMIAIGDTRAEADQLFLRTLSVLDHETRFGRA